MLAWHVDYWDHLGWTDPFGSTRATLRQRRYARALGMKRIGTPSFYAANRHARGDALAVAVDKAAAEAAPLRIEAHAALRHGKVRVAAWFTRLDRKFAPGADIVAFPVLVQRKAVTTCTAGECEDRTLTERFVVLNAAPPTPLAKILGTGLVHEFDAPRAVKADNLSIALLVEDGERMRTLACTSVPVAATAPSDAVTAEDRKEFLAVRTGFATFVGRVGGDKSLATYDAELARLCKEHGLAVDAWRRIGAGLQRARAAEDKPEPEQR